MPFPRVSVLMTVYNSEAYLAEAIESILNQSFTDFKFLIVDDASTDRSKEIIKSYDDPRIILVENTFNLGVPGSSNRGLSVAEGEYIVRMDADDICHPERLKVQVDYMDKHTEIGLCGSFYETFGSREGITDNLAVNSDELKCRLLFSACLMHPTIIIRHSMLRQHDIYYNPEYRYASDYEFCTMCSRHFHIANINHVLLRYRVHEKQISTAHITEQENFAKSIKRNQLEYLGLSPDEQELEIHHILGNSSYHLVSSRGLYEAVQKWLLKLMETNQQTLRFPSSVFNEILGAMFYAICKYSIRTSGPLTIRDFYKSPLSAALINTGR